jgi:hypothetical protein
MMPCSWSIAVGAGVRTSTGTGRRSPAAGLNLSGDTGVIVCGEAAGAFGDSNSSCSCLSVSLACWMAPPLPAVTSFSDLTLSRSVAW